MPKKTGCSPAKSRSPPKLKALAYRFFCPQPDGFERRCVFTLTVFGPGLLVVRTWRTFFPQLTSITSFPGQWPALKGLPGEVMRWLRNSCGFPLVWLSQRFRVGESLTAQHFADTTLVDVKSRRYAALYPALLMQLPDLDCVILG